MGNVRTVPVKHSPKLNQLLGSLHNAAYERLLPDLDLMSLRLGSCLYEEGEEQTHLFFPTSGLVSLLSVTEDGSSAEIAITGNEGVVGITLIMGGTSTASRAVVQSSGFAYRLSGADMMREFGQRGSLQFAMLRYLQALMTQMAQTAVCNRHHSLEQQLCRWLLLSLDRLPSLELAMTQQLIADMLGVRREGVTEAAGRLQDAGMIRYRRGRIQVLDRAKLEAHACECYAVVKKEYDRLLGQRSATDGPVTPRSTAPGAIAITPLKGTSRREKT